MWVQTVPSKARAVSYYSVIKELRYKVYCKITRESAFKYSEHFKFPGRGLQVTLITGQHFAKFPSLRASSLNLPSHRPG
jgi:hypothetical protein